MSRKHFKAIAEALKDSNASLEICQALASQMYQFNQHFDRTRFLQACGY